MERFLSAINEESMARANEDPNRLAYHLMPATGWLNDPNGLVQKDGIYHIFYQYSPAAADGNSDRGWGHYSTKDFIHYTQEVPMLFPDSPMDFSGAYSGSAFEKDGIIHFFYTGNGKIPGDYDYIYDGRIHWVNHFTSKDGFTFSPKETLLKNADYPADLSCHVRDPKILEEDGKYYMVLGARTRKDEGQILVMESEDLKNWKPASRIRPEETFGYMWECPDVFDLDDARLLITCPQGVYPEGYKYEMAGGNQNGWFELKGKMKDDQKVGQFHTLDYGFDFYAPQTFVDEKGRRILIGWMGIPMEAYTNPTVEYGWQHALTLPRQLHMENGTLYQYPIEEMETLRMQEREVNLQANTCMNLDSSVFELQLAIDNHPFEITVRKDVKLTWDGQLFTMDLQNSGSGRTVRHIETDHISELSVFSDTSSLEFFLNKGEYAMTTRVYDDKENLQLCSNISLQGTLYDLSSFTVEQAD